MTDPPTILLCDDDLGVRRSLTDRLEQEGWRVLNERDGDWALRALERRRVDAVVLDVLIPNVNGFQVAERLRALPHGRHVGIVMLTGIFRGSRYRNEAILRYGLLDYLDKPVDLDRLVKVLRGSFARMPAEEARETIAPAPPPPKPPKPKDPWRGNLRRTAFPRLLFRLHDERATGGLFLVRDKVKKIVYFRDGHPAFIKSNLLDECLGRVLCRERIVTRAECAESVRRMRVDRRQQGSVLVAMGVISPQNLRHGLELQLQVKLFELFDWTHGEFAFRSDVPLPTEVIALGLPCAQIILEGIRRVYSHARLRTVVDPLLTARLRLAAGADERLRGLDLQPHERRLLGGLDNERSGRELLASAAALGLDQHGAMALVHALVCTRVLETAVARVERALGVAPKEPMVPVSAVRPLEG